MSGNVKSLNVVEVMLQIIYICCFNRDSIVATLKQGVLSVAARNSLVVMAILSFSY